MASRLKLHNKLKTICNNVYFQPPTNSEMKYPCIIYNLDKVDVKKANDKVYLTKIGYQVKFITNDPDESIDKMFTILENFEYSSLDRQYKSGNLYHNVFKIYY